MNKRRRHATKISESPSFAHRVEQQILETVKFLSETIQNVLENLKQLNFSRLATIPVLLVGAAACSLVLGIGNSSPKPEANTIELSLVQPTAESPSPDTALSDVAAEQNETSIAKSPLIEKGAVKDDRYQLDLDIQTPLQTAEHITQPDAEPEAIIKRTRVKSGDTLSELFQRVGLGATTVYRITNSGKAGKNLTRMFPGEELIFELDGDKQLKTVTRVKSELEQVKFIARDDSFETEAIILKPEIRRVHRSGSINSSLSLAAYDAGISSPVTMNMANIFGGVMDFALDVRPGDHFTVVYEELYLNGEKIDDGNIIAAQYVNSGKVFNAFRYEDSNGDIGYFNESGESMRKVFLRAPLDFTRVSSGFNLRRLHPITKRVKPHRGIDYAAPPGTPIFSVGDGRISASGYSKANGNYVFIRHGESYVTKYLHLKKRHVSKGQRIKQGQIIGSVGCTGLCTGPHLHYEFLVNGVHRNPRTIVSKLPKAKRLAKSELNRFAENTRGQQELMQHYGYKTTVALSD